MENLIPDHIKKLLSGEIHLDCHVLVGDPKINQPERIGVVKWMLIARSEALKAVFVDGETDFKLPDVEPHIFKHFLVFCYNCDVLSSLSFEDGLKLLSLAWKYGVLELITRLGTVLAPQVKLHNLFIFLQYGYICETIPELWKAITELIQNDTDEVLAHPDFVKANEVEVSYIIQQDQMRVQEIDVWNATLRWAKQQLANLGSENSAENLRQVIKPLLKHIRFCTLSLEELCREMASEKILTCDELGQICYSICSKENCISVDYLSNEVQKRKSVTEYKVLEFYLNLNCQSYSYKFSELYIRTKNYPILLSRFVFFNTVDIIENIQIGGGSYQFDEDLMCFNQLIKQNKNPNNQSTSVINEEVLLKANHSFVVRIYLLTLYSSFPVCSKVNNEFFEVEITNCEGYYMSYIKSLHYKVIGLV